MKDKVSALIKTALVTLAAQNIIAEQDIPGEINIERSKDPKHGDLASNISLILAKKANMNPRQLAELLVKELNNADGVTKIEIAGPGFINFTLAKDIHTKIISDIISQKDRFGASNYGKKHTISNMFLPILPDHHTWGTDVPQPTALV